ncbi:MAG: DUF2892 domain-containing protein [Gammaproteobacteria bacterium]|nr:DUF2892 domain-containing protein [Gammaproteobacteria bacterium]
MSGSVLINVDLAERCLRGFTGLVTIFYLLVVPGLPLFFALSYMASLYLLLTALVAWDPLYALFYKVTDLFNLKMASTNRVMSRDLTEDYHFAM